MPKCPKCQYFSFDSGDRCRNCGYDFSLTLDPPADDLRIQDPADPIGPLGDFALNDIPGNLPLFRPEGDPDAPLVTVNPTPRAPLAVRRGAPTTGRPSRAKRDKTDVDPEPRLALDTAEIPVAAPKAPPVVVSAPRPSARAVAPGPAAGAADPSLDTAGPALDTAGAAARIGAALIDLALLGGIDVMVLYFTLKICDLTFGELWLLPAAPLLSFLLLLDGGYLATFVAAGGQTIGKMATGIRVVPADPAARLSERVTFGHAIVRAVAFFVATLPAGLGLLPALFGDHRGLHDRLADTRVVKA
jgi:uncharacterized RDD family membrane protein YckC